MLTWTELKYDGGLEIVAKAPDALNTPQVFAVIAHTTGCDSWFVHWKGYERRLECKTRKAAVAAVEERHERHERHERERKFTA